MMRRMNWRGGGLGIQEQGRLFPIPAAPPVPPRSKERCEEVTFVRETKEASAEEHGIDVRIETPKPPKAPPLRAVLTPDGVVYGYPHPDGLEEVEVTVKGAPRRTGTILEVDLSNVREVETWGSKPVGIAGRFFPKPSEWRLGGIDLDLDALTIKALTGWLVEGIKVQPSCLEAWATRIGTLPQGVGERYNLRLLTPRDWSSHFKNILHRGMWVHREEAPCRCCGHAYENIQHLATCEKLLRHVFRPLYELIMMGWQSPDGTCPLPKHSSLDRNELERFGLFCILPGNIKTPDGWVNFHLLLWKHIIAHMVRIDTEDEKYDPRNIWEPAWIRLERKCLVIQENAQSVLRLYESRGYGVLPDVKKRGRPMFPIGYIGGDGILGWSESANAIRHRIEQLKKNLKKNNRK